MQIAIVEDEPKLVALLEGYLQKADYDCRAYTQGDVALDALIKDPPDLVLLDLMLPGLDGLSLCREFRKHSSVPVIMLTARVEEIDRLLGLEVGADDYICKPYSPREVVARVKAVLRRASPQTDSATNQVIVLDESTATVTVDGQACALTAVELRLLKVMLNKPGQIFNRTQLMNRIYSDGRIVSDRTIDSHIKKLRQKLHAMSDTYTFVHSVYGIGYKFELTPSS
jgi:two-component system, OmpR family, response regulator BaeR